GIPFPGWRGRSVTAASGGLDLGLERSFALAATRGQLLALGLSRRAESKALHDVGVIVLLRALLIRPVIRANVRLNDELIALARVLGDRLSETPEGHEPQTGDGLPGIPLFVLACIVVAHQADARVSAIAFDRQLGILREITDRGDCETIHGDSLGCVSQGRQSDRSERHLKRN